MQQGFREYVGMTPMEFLFDVRLERVHADLTGSASCATVSEAATRWGIMHTGRFAAAYRRKYGVTPSESLRDRGL
jgi:AraC-like DNA-binding protein